ncbi:hypothetical protein [Streptomyces mirabilis]|uniref:hypothetical protein n=1 Tax=Streptomyces mirabilis TaxID=68239 RepID=UPI0021C12AEB|nr:hypothetical protein [Streptomyces mirabilis]MCT9105386.1 hypothetical protein [Streptomyces mirabilis]
MHAPLRKTCTTGCCQSRATLLLDPQVGEAVEDHASGRPEGLVVGVEAAHGLIAAQSLADSAFDEAEHQQGQADHGDQGGDAPIVVQEDRRHGERALEVAAAALDHRPTLVAEEDVSRGRMPAEVREAFDKTNKGK